jgi:hypothetical protein
MDNLRRRLQLPDGSINRAENSSPPVSFQKMLPKIKTTDGTDDHRHQREHHAASKRRTMLFAAIILLWSYWLLMVQNRMSKDIVSNLQISTFTLTTAEKRRDGSTIINASSETSPNASHADISPASQPPSNNSLVIIMGNLRGGEQAWQSLYKNVLDVNSADLALIIGQTNNTSNNLYPNTSLYTRAKYIWTFREYEDWADAIDLINGTEWRETHLPYFTKKRTGLLGGVKGYFGSGAIIFMIRWFLSQHLLHNPDALNQYERFVITRADHYYQCSHEYTNLDLSNNTMWVPQGEAYGGYTDRHLIVSRSNILDALDIFPTLFQQTDKQLQDWIAVGTPESILKRVWTSKGFHVRTTKRVMFTCATQWDKSRWKRAKGDVPGVPGLLKKYESEYNQTQQNCPALIGEE